MLVSLNARPVNSGVMRFLAPILFVTIGTAWESFNRKVDLLEIYMAKNKGTGRKVTSKASKSSGHSSTNGSSLSKARACGRSVPKVSARSDSKVSCTGRVTKTKSVAGSALSQASSKSKRSNFLRTARSLNLEGPKDWSARFDDYHNGRKG